MSNPYITYYNNQSGDGLAHFQGLRVQRGHGFFGSLISGLGSILKGFAPGLFKSVLPSKIGLAEDLISGQDFKSSAKTRLKEAGKSAGNYTLDNLKNRLQSGSGRKRRKKFNKRVKRKKW